jgi:hypothetical protein
MRTTSCYAISCPCGRELEVTVTQLRCPGCNRELLVQWMHRTRLGRVEENNELMYEGSLRDGLQQRKAAVAAKLGAGR